MKYLKQRISTCSWLPGFSINSSSFYCALNLHCGMRASRRLSQVYHACSEGAHLSLSVIMEQVGTYYRSFASPLFYPSYPSLSTRQILPALYVDSGNITFPEGNTKREREKVEENNLENR